MRLVNFVVLLSLLALLGCVSVPEKKETVNLENLTNETGMNKTEANLTDKTNETKINESGTKINETNQTTAGTGANESSENETKTEAKLTIPLPSSELLEWKKLGRVVIDGVSSSSYIWDGEKIRMYYTGPGGILLAESDDGVNFVKRGTVLGSENKDEMVSNQVIFKLKNGKYRMLYEMQNFQEKARRLYSAISDDGLAWARESGVRYWDYGQGGSIFTSVPDIIEMNGTLIMYYTAGVVSRIAVSKDEGITWTKKQDIDVGMETVLDPDIVRLDDGTYKLFFTTFTGKEFGVGKQVILSASSLDGFNFVLDNGTRIGPDIQSEMVVDPDIVYFDGRYIMYYGQMETIFSIFAAESSIGSDKGKDLLILAGGYKIKLEDVAVLDNGQSCALLAFTHQNGTIIKKASVCQGQEYYWTNPEGHRYRMLVLKAVGGYTKSQIWADIIVYG